MGDWKIIVPEATTNLVLNPSAETTGNYAAVGGASVTRVSTYQMHGVYSYRVQTSANLDGISFDLIAMGNYAYTASARVRGTLPAAWAWSVDKINYHEPVFVMSLDDNWDLYAYTFPAAECNTNDLLSIVQIGAGAGTFYIDGVQVEQADHWTTYCDGDQDGCFWNGAPHASSSSRSAMSRAGGRVYDLRDDFYFNVGAVIGAQAAPQSVVVSGYALLPGGELNTIKPKPRVFSLAGVMYGSSMADLHDKKQALLAVLNPHAVPATEHGLQPLRLWYTGADVVKEIAVHYEGGLEGSIDAADPCAWERLAIRFLAPDPFWYGIGERAVELNTKESTVFRYCAGRLRETGEWDDLGLTANPTVGGTIMAIAYNPVDGLVYFGGSFQGMDGMAGRDNIAAYDPVAGTWSTVGGGGAVNGAVYAIAIAPNGDVYIGGDFTNCGGAAGDYVAYYDISAGAWTPVAAGGTGPVYALAFGLDGTLYIGGDFDDWAGLPWVDNIAQYRGGYGGVGLGISGALPSGGGPVVYALCVTPDNQLYAGGMFTSASGVAVSCIARYDIDGDTWYDCGGGMTTDPGFPLAVLSITATNAGVYAGGVFNYAGGVSAVNLAVWNGASWQPVSGLYPPSYTTGMCVGADGTVWLPGGSYLRVLRGSIVEADIDLGSARAYSCAVCRPDPVVNSNYDVFIGMNSSGSLDHAGSATAVVNGTAPTYPRISIQRVSSAGTTYTVTSIRNETTGSWLNLYYEIQGGETLTIDLSPPAISATSSLFGLVNGALLAGSDTTSFTLLPGTNQITALVKDAGVGAIEAFCIWRDVYWSYD